MIIFLSELTLQEVFIGNLTGNTVFPQWIYSIYDGSEAYWAETHFQTYKIPKSHELVSEWRLVSMGYKIYTRISNRLYL